MKETKIKVTGYPIITDFDVRFENPFLSYFTTDNFEKFKLPERYIINKNAAILFWKDDSKTVVRRTKDDKHNKRIAFLTAYFQKHSGLSKTKANKFLDNLTEED